MRPQTIEKIHGNPAKKINLRSALRISMPVTTLIYCAGFNYAYVNWISPVWSYEGFIYKSPATPLLICGYILGAGLCAISPLRIRRPSQVVYWILFFTVYIPGLFVPLFQQLVDSLTLLLLQLSLTGGMLLIALSYRVPVVSFRRYPLDPHLFWVIFGVIFLFGNAALLVAFRGNLHIASIKDVYSVRFQAQEILVANPAMGYITQLLSCVMNPLLIAYGLTSRRKKVVALGTLGQILLYSTSALKQIFVSPFVALALFYTIKRDRGGWVPKMGLFFAGMFFVLTTLVIDAKPGALFELAAVVLARTFAGPGMLIGQYQYFFEHFPHTHLGNITGLNLLLPNPYALPIGKEMGSFYGVGRNSKFGMVNENANFFATDGIGGFGLPGILLIAILCAAVFWMLDSCARKYPLELSVPSLTMIIISLANVSLFSTLLGNGLIVWILLCIVMPRHILGGESRP